MREKLFQYRLKEAKANKTPPWEDLHLDKVLKKLKAGKARDADNLVNELFILDNIGSDLKESLKILLNKMKTQLAAPKFINNCNIFSLYKGKNDKSSLENDRGSKQDETCFLKKVTGDRQTRSGVVKGCQDGSRGFVGVNRMKHEFSKKFPTESSTQTHNLTQLTVLYKYVLG